MGMPMAPNYASRFMDKFDEKILSEYFIKTVCHNLYGFDLLMTFFIQTSSKEPLNEFIQFAQDFSENSKIKDVNIFQNSANFFNVKIIFDNEPLKQPSSLNLQQGNTNTNNYTINILPDILKTWATFSMLKLSWKMEPLKRSLKQPSSLKLQTLIYI